MSAAARSRRTPNATRVAVISALAISFLAVLVTFTADRSGTYQLRATFDDVRGLIEGGQVRAGAIKVGSVRRVFLNEDGYPEAVLEIDDDFRLHEGAKANLMLGSNAGVVNRVIELTQGNPAAPTLPDGTTLTRARTDQPVNFDEAADTLNPRTRSEHPPLPCRPGRGNAGTRPRSRSHAAPQPRCAERDRGPAGSGQSRRLRAAHDGPPGRARGLGARREP